MAVSRQPETITSETSNREGLHEDQPPRGETRWKRFHPFKVVRKIFCRRVKRQGTEEVQENSKKSWSTSELQNIPDEESRYQDHTPPYKVGLSVSHDSIFSHDHSTISMDPDELQEMQASSLSIHETEIRDFHDELFTIVRARRDSDDDDVGLPRSPCTSPTTADILAQGLKKPTKSLNTCSAGSLASMESSENDEDSAGQLSSGHSSRASLLDRSTGTDSDIDISQPIPLSHKAALHKIAVRPKRTHALPRRRRLKQMTSPTTNSLPVTPEVSEEGKHSPLTSVKSQRKTECITKISDEIQTTQHIDRLSQFRVKVSSTQQTSNMKQQNRKTFSSGAETKPSDIGVQLIRSRSAAAELRSYQETRQKNLQSVDKKDNKQTKDIKYTAYQNKGVTITVNKTETIFAPDGSVTTVQQRTTESGHSIAKETQLECYEDTEKIEIPNINENRRSMTDFSKHDPDLRRNENDPTQQAKCISISASIKDMTGGAANKNVGTKLEHRSSDDRYIGTEGKRYETSSASSKDVPFVCSNAKTVLSTLENLTDDNKQVLCNSAEMQNPQSIAVVTVTQSETSHLIRETAIGENVKLSVMGAYGKTVIHTGGDIWSVSNINNRDTNEDLKQKDLIVEKSEVAYSNEEHICDERLEIKREPSPKMISKSHYDSPVEYFVVDNQKLTTPQKRFSVEIVPFNQRIKDPNYLYSSGKIENRFKTTEKALNDSSGEVILKTENKYIDKADTKLKDHHVYKLEDSPAENKKPVYPIHIKIHKGKNVEDKSGTTSHHSEVPSSQWTKDCIKKETAQVCKEILPEFTKIQLNSSKIKDEKLIAAGDTNIISYSIDNDVQAAKHKQDVGNNFLESTAQIVSLSNAKESPKNVQVNSNATSNIPSNKHFEKEAVISEDSVMEVNVKESAQLWEKMAATENLVDAKSKPVSRSSSTTSEEEPELLRVFARRSIKQKTDDKEATTKECESTTENLPSVGTFVEDLSDSTGSNIISMSNNSTIIKISETAGMRSVIDTKSTLSKLQYFSAQDVETETQLPFTQKSHKSDVETKCVGSKIVTESADSYDLKVPTESKPAVIEPFISIEKEQKLLDDKKISVKRISSESQKSATDTKQSFCNVTSVCTSKPVCGAKAEIVSRTDSFESKPAPTQRLLSETGAKLPIHVKPVLHNISVDAKTVTDVDAKIGSVPSSGQERDTEVVVASVAKNVLSIDSAQKISKPALTEKPKFIDKEIVSSQSPTKQHILATAEASIPSSRWHGNKLRSHTVSEVSQADIQRAHLRQRKASAPDISSCRNDTEISAKEISSYCTPSVQASKPELPPKSPSVTALAATRNSALSLSMDSAKSNDASHELTKNNKEANLPSWLQLAQQRREQREQRERLLMGPAAASFVLETSGKPTRNSKVWDMVHNFQKLQMT